MKKLELVKGKDDKRFEYIFNGFIIGGNMIQQKGIAVLRRELSILEKLESISKPCECNKKIMAEEARDLVGGAIELTVQEFDILYSYIGSVPWSTGKPIREALATLDWLKSL